jgi:hypothetical protein
MLGDRLGGIGGHREMGGGEITGININREGDTATVGTDRCIIRRFGIWQVPYLIESDRIVYFRFSIL